MRLKLPICPHCQKRVNWFRAWALKTQGEYRCNKCGACSNVALDKLIYPLAIVAAGAGAVFFILFVALVREFSFTALLLIAVPFLLFFLISPFFVRLRPVQSGNPRPVRRRPANGNPPSVPVDTARPSRPPTREPGGGTAGAGPRQVPRGTMRGK